jgi:hypothetical protein
VRIALAAIVLWIAGLEVFPNLHIALHDSLAPHTHKSDGDTVFSVSFEDTAHVHPDGTIHRPTGSHRAGPKHPVSPKSRTQDLALRLAHGAHAFAHHTAAVTPSAPPLHMPLPVDRRPTYVAAVATTTWISEPVARASARGPPAPSV